MTAANPGTPDFIHQMEPWIDEHEARHMAEYLASGVLELRLAPSGKALTRSLVLRKMRATPFEPGEYPVTLDQWSGLSVGQPSSTGNVREFAAV